MCSWAAAASQVLPGEVKETRYLLVFLFELVGKMSQLLYLCLTPSLSLPSLSLVSPSPLLALSPHQALSPLTQFGSLSPFSRSLSPPTLPLVSLPSPPSLCLSPLTLSHPFISFPLSFFPHSFPWCLSPHPFPLSLTPLTHSLFSWSR